MMFVRPKNCTYCEHGYYGLLHVVQYAQSKGLWTITDLSAEQAVKETIYPKIDETDPFGYMGFGHGSSCRYTGDTEQDIFECEECSKLSGRIVYLLSCLTANGLGYKIIENGATAYAGYNISWTWVSEGEPPTGDPYEDKYAYGYWESANELWMALIDGDDFYTAVQKCLDKYDQWIDYWYQSDDPDAAQVMMWLVHDRDGLVALDSCSVKYSEQDCLASGCLWVNGKCYSHPPPPQPRSLSIVIPLIPIIILVGLAFIAGQTKPKNIYTD
jgi:hypothetical protein